MVQRTVTRGERKRGESGVVGPEAEKPSGLVVAAPTSSSPRKRSRESGARQPVGGAGQASLVRVKLKTGSRGKYKAESRRQAGATVCGTPVHTQCNPEEIFTTGNLQTGTE